MEGGVDARGAATAHWSHWDLSGVAIGSVAALAIIWAWSPAGGAAAVNASSATTAITVVGLGHRGDWLPASGAETPAARLKAAGSLSREHGSGLVDQADAVRRRVGCGRPPRYLGIDPVGAQMGHGPGARSDEAGQGMDPLLAIRRRHCRHHDCRVGWLAGSAGGLLMLRSASPPSADRCSSTSATTRITTFSSSRRLLPAPSPPPFMASFPSTFRNSFPQQYVLPDKDLPITLAGLLLPWEACRPRIS